MKKAISTDDGDLADTEEPQPARVSDDEEEDAAHKDELLIKGDGSEDWLDSVYSEHVHIRRAYTSCIFEYSVRDANTILLEIVHLINVVY